MRIIPVSADYERETERERERSKPSLTVISIALFFSFLSKQSIPLLLCKKNKMEKLISLLTHLDIGRINCSLGLFNSCIKSKGFIHQRNIIVDRFRDTYHWYFHLPPSTLHSKTTSYVFLSLQFFTLLFIFLNSENVSGTSLCIAFAPAWVPSPPSMKTISISLD